MACLVCLEQCLFFQWLKMRQLAYPADRLLVITLVATLAWWLQLQSHVNDCLPICFTVIHIISSFLHACIYTFVPSFLECTSFHMLDPVAYFHLTVSHSPGQYNPPCHSTCTYSTAKTVYLPKMLHLQPPPSCMSTTGHKRSMIQTASGMSPRVHRCSPPLSCQCNVKSTAASLLSQVASRSSNKWRWRWQAHSLLPLYSLSCSWSDTAVACLWRT